MITIQGEYWRTRHDPAGDIHPSIFDSACAMYAAQESMQKYRLCTYEDLLSGRLDLCLRTDVMVGSVEFMMEVWRRLEVSPDVPMNSTTPAEIKTMAQVRQAVADGHKMFAKPIKPKMYDMSGTVFSPEFPNQYSSVPDDAEVLTYPAFPHRIVSEWRCYVHNGRVEYAANYSGDIRVSLDWYAVDSAMRTAASCGFPCAYTADFAVLEDGSTEVVEFNDFWAIGNYGMDNHTYLRMLKERYVEIALKRSCWDIQKK